ncbi:hypothetical protein ACWFRJ_34830 [Streptomyces sp. NPDC055239]
MAVAVALLRAGAIPGCHRAAESGSCDVGLIMLLGMLGAPAHVVGRLQKMGGSWNPYSLPFYQELSKLPIGALTAVLGLLLVDTEWLPLIKAPTTWRDVTAYAVVFGLAQITLTRNIDHHAEKILASEPDQEEAEQLERIPDNRVGRTTEFTA